MVHNLTRFFKDSTGRKRVERIMQHSSNATSKGLIPRPAGGLYLKHAAIVIVHIREHSGTSTFLPLRQHY
jgi:hypothetical protein